MENIVLTQSQLDLESKIDDAIRRHQDFVVHGLAGTGKSVILGHMAKKYPQAKVVAPTGKAALVASTKMGRPAGTIHSLFYKLVGTEEAAPFNPIFKNETQIKPGSIVMIDECSMVSIEMRNDIKKTGATIIAFGDHGQLPPVMTKPGFPKADFVLTEIHRQAHDSPIITQAHRVRSGLDYEDICVPGFEKLKTLDNANLLKADVVLCYKNTTRRDLNNTIRLLKGFTGEYPQVGEPVMCMRNLKKARIMNGGVYNCVKAYDPKSKNITLDVDGFPTTVRAMWQEFPGELPIGMTIVDLGYACTVHKSQGSEWDNVLFLDDYGNRSDRKEFLYTAITRAAKHIAIFKV